MAKTSEIHVVSVTRLLATVIVVALRFTQTFGTPEPVGQYCARPGDRLTFECTTVPADATIWHGSAFDCDQNQPPNELFLSHTRILSGIGARGTCNNGDIVAQGTGVNAVNNTYYLTSQLNVTASSDMHNKTIECDRDDGWPNGARVTLSVFKIILTTEGECIGP